MIHIKKESVNQCVFTLTELMDDPRNPILMRIESEMSKERSTQYFRMFNNTSKFARYDIYTIIEQDFDLNPMESVIHLPETGFWEYTAFEINRDSVKKGTALEEIDLSALNKLETGRIHVQGKDEVLLNPVQEDDVYK